jgi:hypothetical protein
VIAPKLVRRSCWIVVALACALPGVAHAQDIAAAEGLFREGRALMESGRIDEACRKFAESQRLDPSSGTLINLAACHEKQGRTATAWAEYLAAARIATTQGKHDRVEEAKRLAAQLEPELSYLTVVVSKPVAGLEVRRGDVKLEANSLGSKIPTDPGTHEITVSAPGHEPVTLSVTLAAKGDQQTITVPALVEAKDAAVPPAQPHVASSGTTTTPADQPTGAVRHDAGQGSGRTLGLIVGGAGIVAIGVGATFGLLSMSSYDEAEERCPSRAGCDQDALDLRDEADVRANVANVGIGVGVAALSVGAILFLTAGGDPPAEAKVARRARRGGLATSTRLVPVVGSHGAGLSWAGAF